MRFAGIQKTTLIDFPGKVAATLFTYGCDFRCPFCHNPELVIEKPRGMFSEDVVLEFLSTRVDKLDGIVITGGEPLMNEGIKKFIHNVKKMGFLVKVDTNGYHPNQIKKLLELVDYWAMDIKNGEEKYNKTTGIVVEMDRVKESIKIIKDGGKDYEFRTTFVPGLHDETSAKNIGKLIKGAKRYTIQNFVCGKTISKQYSKKESFKEEDLEKFEKAIKPYVEEIKVLEN